MKLRAIDPLFQFLGAGALLFALSWLVDPFTHDELTIRVDRAELEQYLVSGGGEALAAMAKAGGGAPTLASLTKAQRQELVKRFVEEQALFREARSWGLDQGDIVIRRRLGQSLQFALRPQLAADPGDAVLRQFYAKHRENYQSATETSFDHVFFSADQRGPDGALEAAQSAIRTGLGDWRAQGDRFPFQRSYSSAGTGVVEAQLGSDFVAAIDKLPVDPERWQGPVQSLLGYHLVRVNRRSVAGLTPFEDIRLAVLDDWQRQSQSDELDRTVEGIVRKYQVEMDDDVFAGAGEAP